MTRKEALQYVRDNYPFDEESEFWALGRLRNEAVMLPEIGVDGSVRDESNWIYIDLAGKIDTGMYGDVYYFKDMKKDMIWIPE